eukprot:12413834-Karenia_brevis.AAC.1
MDTNSCGLGEQRATNNGRWHGLHSRQDDLRINQSGAICRWEAKAYTHRRDGSREGPRANMHQQDYIP